MFISSDSTVSLVCPVLDKDSQTFTLCFSIFMQFHFMQFLLSSDQKIIMLLEWKSFEHTLCGMNYNKHVMEFNKQ